MIKDRIILLLSLIIIFSCQKKFDNVEEIKEYVSNEDNGYVSTKKVKEIEFKLVYLPVEIMMQLNNIKDYEEKELFENFNKCLYFQLSISKNNQDITAASGQSRVEAAGALQDLSFNMEDKIFILTQKNDTIKLLDYSYPRMYGMSNSTDLLLVFPKEPSLLKDKYIEMTIRDIGHLPEALKFSFTTDIMSRKLYK